MANARLRPGDRHDAGRAVELRNIETDSRLAVVVKLDRTGKERHQLFGGRAALKGCPCAITTGAQTAGGAQRTVDQAAIEVADFQPQPALAEIPFIRLRRLVTREVQNADIHRRNNRIGLFADTSARNRDRNFKRLARQRLLRRTEGHGKLALGRVDSKPLDADGPHRHAAFLRIAGPEQRGGDVSARTPFLGDRNVDLAAIRADLGILNGNQLFRAGRDHQLAGKTRGDLEFGRIADLVALLVQRDFQRIRRFGRACLNVETGIEFNAGNRCAIAGALHFQPVAAPGDRHGNLAAIGIDGQGAGLLLLGIFHRLVTPGIALTIPLIVPLNLDELPVEAAHRLFYAIGTNADDMETTDGILGEIAGKLRLDADNRSFRLDRQRQRTLHGTSTRLLHAHGDVGGKKLRGGGQISEINIEARLARFVQHRQIGKRRAVLLFAFLIRQTEEITFEISAGARWLDGNFTFQRQAGGRSAIEITAVDIDCRFRVRVNLLCLAREVKLGAVRHEIIDQKALFADRRRFRIGMDAHCPGAAHRICLQRQIDRMAAQRLAIADEAPVLDTVRAREDEGKRQILDCLAIDVASKRCGMHGLAGAVDAAFGPAEHIDRAGCCTSRHAAIRKIEAGTGHVEEHVVLVAVPCRQDCGRLRSGAAHQAGGKHRTAIRIGLRSAQHLVILGEQLQIHICQRLRAAKCTDKDVESVGSGIGGDAGIGDQEPLRGARIPGFRCSARRHGGQHIDAGLTFRQSFIHREARHHILVEIRLDIDRALPDEFAYFVFDTVGIVTVHLRQKLRIRK